MIIPTRKALFLSDLDGTWLSKNPQNRADLDRGVTELRDEFRSRGVELKFGYVTARPPEFVALEKLPEPDFTLCFNGATIQEGAPDAPLLGEWISGHGEFRAETAVKECRDLMRHESCRGLSMKTVGETFHRPEPDACPHTTTLCFDLSSIALTAEENVDADGNGRPDVLESATFSTPTQIRNLLDDLSERLEVAGVAHRVSEPYLAHGRPYLSVDIGAPQANKGAAVDFLRRREGVSADHLIIAGDAGNDLSMMQDPQGQDDGRRAIVVGGDSRLRQAGGALRNGLVQPAGTDCALGVLDGLRRHLEQIATSTLASKYSNAPVASVGRPPS